MSWVALRQISQCTDPSPPCTGHSLLNCHFSPQLLGRFPPFQWHWTQKRRPTQTFQEPLRMQKKNPSVWLTCLKWWGFTQAQSGLPLCEELTWQCHLTGSQLKVWHVSVLDPQKYWQQASHCPPWMPHTSWGKPRFKQIQLYQQWPMEITYVLCGVSCHVPTVASNGSRQLLEPLAKMSAGSVELLSPYMDIDLEFKISLYVISGSCCRPRYHMYCAWALCLSGFQIPASACGAVCCPTSHQCSSTDSSAYQNLWGTFLLGMIFFAMYVCMAEQLMCKAHAFWSALQVSGYYNCAILYLLLTVP